MTPVAIQLPDDLSQFVNQTIQSGDFHNADEFFMSVVSIYKDQVESKLSESDQSKIELLRREIQSADAQLNRGEGIEIDWNAKLAARHRAYAARHSS